jgi:hypothetical protein
MMNSPNTTEGLLKRIKNKRREIKSFLSLGTRLTYLNIICGSIATVLTAVPAIGGKTVLETLLGDSDPDSLAWRIPFASAALFSLLATIAANLYKTQDIASRTGKAEACDAKLEGLQTSLELNQTTVKNATNKYKQYISEIPFVSRKRGSLLRKSSSIDTVNGEIFEPQRNQVVEKTFPCSVWVENLGAACHLWLAVEINGQIWPKERELHLDEDGTWRGIVREEGGPEVFSLCLFAAGDKANQQIEAWRDRGIDTGDYQAFRRLPDTRLIASIDGLHRQTTA